MWNEEEHPRGQPDNKGQFAEKSQTDRRGYNSQSDIQPLKKSFQDKANLPERAYGFADKKFKNAPHHIQHAKGMGFKNQDAYELAGIYFWEKGAGDIFYGSKRGRFAKYNEKTTEYVIVDNDGTLRTYYLLPKKQFEKKMKQEEYKKWIK